MKITLGWYYERDIMNGIKYVKAEINIFKTAL